MTHRPRANCRLAGTPQKVTHSDACFPVNSTRVPYKAFNRKSASLYVTHVTCPARGVLIRHYASLGRRRIDHAAATCGRLPALPRGELSLRRARGPGERPRPVSLPGLLLALAVLVESRVSGGEGWWWRFGCRSVCLSSRRPNCFASSPMTGTSGHEGLSAARPYSGRGREGPGRWRETRRKAPRSREKRAGQGMIPERVRKPPCRAFL